MEITTLLQALAEHNKTGKGYQIQLNSGNLDKENSKNMDVEFADLYFTACKTLRNTELLCFDNIGRKPVSKLEDGTNVYPMEINSHMFLDLRKVEAIEEVKDFEDWFSFPSERVVNIYMFPQNNRVDGCRNVITIGFMG